MQVIYFLVGKIEFARSRVEGNENVFARFVAGLFDGLQNHFQSLFVRLEVGSETAFVAHTRRKAFFLEHILQGVERFGTPTQSFAERRSPHRHNHEFLKIDVAVGMRTTVEDVHHGDGKRVGVYPAHIAVKLLVAFLCGGFGAGQRNAQNGVRTQLTFVGRAVQGKHLGIDGVLFFHHHTLQFFADNFVNVLYGLQHTLSAKGFLIPVAQLHRFVNTRGGTRRNGGAA